MTCWCRAEHIGALGHEVHTAEHDVIGVRSVRNLAREAKGVARVVSELDDLVTLIVVTQNDEPVAEPGSSRGDPRVHLVV